MGQIRKRGGVYWIRYYRDGRRYEESARTDKWKVAEALLKQKEGAIASGEAVSPTHSRFRFEDAVQILMNYYTVNDRRSRHNVQTTILDGALEPWFRKRRMASIDEADIDAYIAHRLERGYANGTINRELAILKRLFSLAIKKKKLRTRPDIQLLTEDNARQGFFERAQFESVRNHLAPLYQAIVTLAYYSGWRINSEILPLEWRQIDRQHSVIRLEPGMGKTRQGREFMYGSLVEVTAAVEGLWARHEALAKAGTITALVFCRRRGQAIKSFFKRWRTAAEAAGCPGRVPHDFRRTAVRNLTRAGVPQSVAMKVTGHKTADVFRRYDIVSEEDLAEASRRLQELTGTIAGTALQDAIAQSVKCSAKMVARGGIEPSTLRFSVVCSTN